MTWWVYRVRIWWGAYTPIAPDLVALHWWGVCPWLTRTAGGVWVQRETRLERAIRRQREAIAAAALAMTSLVPALQQAGTALQAFGEAFGRVALRMMPSANRNIH